jgi:uncharacterized RDD family membrane protein YckC
LGLTLAHNEENVSKLLLILSHKLRRDILMLLHEKKEQSFSELMNFLEVDTGKMSFHLRNLKLFLDQTPAGKYKLNRLGQKALELTKDVEALSIDVDFLENQSSSHVAKFSRRALAFVFDMGVTFTVTVAATLVAELLVLFTGQFVFHQNIFLFLGLLWLYSTLLEGYAGQTIGKSMLMIKVVSVTSSKVSYEAAAVRNFGKCFLLPVDLLLGLRIKDERFIKFFDKYSRTTVIKL